LRIVLDTNVLVSGLLSPFGPPGEIVRLVSTGLLSLCLDARIVSEYRDVLARPKFGFDPDAVATLLDYLESSGEMVASQPLATRLPDPDDEPFLEVALAALADALVTGNLGHYPPGARAGAGILSPAELVELYRSELREFEAAVEDGAIGRSSTDSSSAAPQVVLSRSRVRHSP
jgi:putative PIN family toxin of toxin-antitoxin system